MHLAIQINRFPTLANTGELEYCVKKAIVKDAWYLAMNTGGMGDCSGDTRDDYGCLECLISPASES